MSNREPGASAPGSLSVAELLLGGAQQAVRDGASECVRADGKRGMVYLTVTLCLGDRGQPLWLKNAVYFEQQRHQKDARETLGG